MLTIALIGRPNVGKSALFNRICKKRISIVDEMEGVTRDRLYAEGELFGRPFRLIDTAGIDEGSDDPFAEKVRAQSERAIEEADGLVLVVDAVAGITTLDRQVASLARKSGKPVVVAVNKIDSPEREPLIHDFHALGIDPLIGVSAVHGLHIAELLEPLLGRLEDREEEEAPPRIGVAIVGRPNVGKSTLLNYLLSDERSVVSDIAGTTRDSIDVDIDVDGTPYRLIDTAGIRNKRAEHEVVDKFAAIRTEEAIERADVCLLIIDALEGLTSQERRIAAHITDHGKACLLIINKWDAIHGYRTEHCLKQIHEEAPFLAAVPTLFISAKTGKHVERLFPAIEELYGAYTRRVTTGRLNAFIEKALQKLPPPMVQGKRLRIYYMTQKGEAPPRFFLFINHKDRITAAYEKYLINAFREAFGFAGVPFRFIYREKEKRSRSM